MGLAHGVVDLTAVKDVGLRDFFHLQGAYLWATVPSTFSYI